MYIYKYQFFCPYFIFFIKILSFLVLSLLLALFARNNGRKILHKKYHWFALAYPLSLFNTNTRRIPVNLRKTWNKKFTDLDIEKNQ